MEANETNIPDIIRSILPDSSHSLSFAQFAQWGINKKVF